MSDRKAKVEFVHGAILIIDDVLNVDHCPGGMKVVTGKKSFWIPNQNLRYLEFTNEVKA